MQKKIKKEIIFPRFNFQSMARTLYVEDDINLVDFAAHPAYQLDYLGDWEAYFTTAYFVDPAIICNGGRTEAEFQSQGLGDRLVVQVLIHKKRNSDKYWVFNEKGTSATCVH